MPSVWDEAEKGTSVWDQAEAEPQGAISATKRFLRDVVVPTPARAVAGMQQGIGGMNQWIGETVIPDALGGKALADAGRQWVAEGKAVSEEIEREHPVDPHSWSGATVAALNSIAQQAVPLTVGVVTGNPAIPLAAMGTQTAGQKYGQKRAEGFDILKSGMAAAGHGIAEVATEKFATEKLFELVKAPVASTLAKMFGGELVGENVATITQDMIDKGYAKPGMTDREAANAVKEYFTSGEAWQAVKDTTKSTVLQTALMGGAVKGANRLLSPKQAVTTDTDLLSKKGDAQERSEIAQAVRETRDRPAVAVPEPAAVPEAYTGPVMDAEAATQEDIDLAAMQRENELYRQQQLMDRAGIPEVPQAPPPQVPTSFKTADGKASVKTKVIGEGVYQVDTTTVDEFGHKKTFSQEMSAEDAVKHIDSITPPVTRDQFMKTREVASGQDADARNERVAGDAEVKGDGQPGPQDLSEVQLLDEGQRGEVPGLRNEVLGDRQIGEGVSRPVGVRQEPGGTIPDQAGGRGAAEASRNVQGDGAAKVEPVEAAKAAEAGATEATAAVGGLNNSQKLKSVTDAAVAGADSFGNLPERTSLMKQGGGPVNVPGNIPQGGRLDTSFSQSTVDSGVVDSKLLGDIIKTKTLASKGYGSLDVPSRSLVLKSVLSLIHDDKVFRSVIATIPVDVVNKLIGKKVAPKDLARNKAVFIHALATNDDLPIRSAAIDAIVRSPAISVAKIPLIDLGSRAGDTSTAPQALNSNDIHDAATSNLNTSPLPTPSQIKAGNYQKAHLKINGLDITIENPEGSIRTGIDENGSTWATKLQSSYGYIKGSVGKDGDHVDIFLGPSPETAEHVFVVDQLNPKTGKLDEHKVLLGWDTAEAARQGYLANYDKSGKKRIGAITRATLPEFKSWLEGGNMKRDFAAGITPVRQKLNREALKIGKTKQLEMEEAARVIPEDDIPYLRAALQNVKDADFGNIVIDGNRAEANWSTFGELAPYLRDAGVKNKTEAVRVLQSAVNEGKLPPAKNKAERRLVEMALAHEKEAEAEYRNSLDPEQQGAYDDIMAMVDNYEVNQDVTAGLLDFFDEMRMEAESEKTEGADQEAAGEVATGEETAGDQGAAEVVAKEEATDDAGGLKQSVGIEGDRKVPTIGGVQKQGGKRASTSDLMDAFTPEPEGLPFSAKGEKSGLIAAIVKKELSPLINRLKDAYNVDVLQSERDLRPELMDQVKSENVEGRVEGLYDPERNKILLIADNLKDLTRAEEVLKHELVHKGIAAVFGNRLNMHLDQIRAERKLKSRREAEEFIAEKGEQFAGQGAIKRFIASARQMLRDMGFKVKFSDNDILSIARRSMEATEKGAVGIHADGARFSLKDKAQAVKEAMGEKTMKEHAASVLDWTHNMFNNPGGLGAIDHARELLAERNLFKGALDALQNTQHQIYQGMRTASKETKEKIFNYLEDAEANAMDIPVEYRQAATKAKQMIMDVGAKLVERKMLPADIYEANKGRYLPRTYLKHIIGDEGRAMITGGGSIKAYLGYLKKRLETTDEQRIAWGQIKDPGYLASRAYGLPMRDMEVFDYFDRLINLDEGRGSWVLPKMLTPWVVTGDKAIQQIGGVTYTKNDDGTVNLDIRKVSHVKTKHERVKGADLDTLLGSDKLGAFVRGGGGSVVMKKEGGQPKATGWKRVGHIKYRTYADGTYKVELTNKVITNQKIDNVDPDGLSKHVSESQATRIRDGKGKVINGRTVTPYWLAAEADRILTKQVPNQPEPDRTKAIEIAKRMQAKADEMMAELGKDSREVAAHYAQMPDSPKYGALRGLWVRKELYNDVVGNMKITIGERSWPEIISDYLFIKGMAIWKGMKTAANVPGQIRNFISNHFLLHMSGVPLAMVPIRMAQAAKEMRTNGKHWQVAKRGGIKSSGLANTELYRAEQDLLDMAAQDKPWYHPRFILKWLNKGMDATGDLYQMWESMGKTAKIIHEMNTKRYRYKDGSTVSWYQSKEGAVNRVATEKEAVVEAHEALFDYSLAPGWVKFIRKWPFGSPFITFTYKMLPAIIKTAAQRPLTFAPYLALSYGLPYLIMAMTGIDDKDDYDRLKETVAKFIREKLHTYILPVKDAKGRWQIIDIGYYFPWTGWLAFANHVAKGEIKTALADDLGLGGSPVIDLASAVMFNQDTFTKQPIYDEKADFNEQAGQMMTYLYALGAPPWLTNRGAAGKLWSAMNDEIGKPGQMKPTVGQGLGSLVGANVYAFDPSVSREQNIKGMKFEISKQKSQMNSELKDRDLSRTEKAEVVLKYKTRIQKMNRELDRYIAKSTPKDPSLFKR